MWLAAKHEQLGRVALVVTEAEVIDLHQCISALGPDAGQLGALLLQLCPSVLTSLHLERQPSLPAAALNMLAPLSRLTSLRLASIQLPDNTADALAALHHLQRFSCTTASRQRLGQALARLPPLEHLEVGTRGLLLLPRLAEGIRKHSGLGSLTLEVAGSTLSDSIEQAEEAHAGLLRCLRGLSQLTRLQLTITDGIMPALGPALVEIPRLCHFRFEVPSGELPEPAAFARLLETCEYYTTDKFRVSGL